VIFSVFESRPSKTKTSKNGLKAKTGLKDCITAPYSARRVKLPTQLVYKINNRCQQWFPRFPDILLAHLYVFVIVYLSFMYKYNRIAYSFRVFIYLLLLFFYLIMHKIHVSNQGTWH